MRPEFLSQLFDNLLDFGGIRETAFFVMFSSQRHANVHVRVAEAEAVDRRPEELERGVRIEFADESLQFLEDGGPKASLLMLRTVILRNGVENGIQGRLVECRHRRKRSQFCGIGMWKGGGTWRGGEGHGG